MAEIKRLSDVETVIQEARDHFKKSSRQVHSELDEVFFFTLKLLKSVSKFYTPEKWTSSREGHVLAVLSQCIETLLAMYVLSESGFWTNSLVLKRNCIELMCVFIAIGYDNQCYIDWKHGRDNFSGFKKILKCINLSNCIPELDKNQVALLKKEWEKSSDLYSHYIGIRSIRTKVESGFIKFEPKVAGSDFQDKRLCFFRNMFINLMSIVMGVFDYGGTTERRKGEFPEALDIIAHANLWFQDEKLRQQKTT